MASIIRGTTPTLKYKFNDVKVSDIATAYLSIQTGNPETDIEKSLVEADVGQDYISWTLTQQECLSFGDSISMMINWKLSNGTRGASDKTTIIVADNYKEVEI